MLNTDAKTLLWSALWFFAILTSPVHAQEYKAGTWKTAQTIAPFYYQDFLPDPGKVEVYSFTNPADQKTALLAGSLDMCGTTLAHAIHSASQGQPVVVVAALCNKCSALVVKTDGPITRVEDLRGKRIGYVPGTMHEILLRETLVRHGLSPDKDVTLLRVDFFDMGMALAKGSIDAFLSGEPFPALAAAKGYGRILTYPYYGEAVGAINAGILMRRDFIESNPEMAYNLVKAHVLATEFLKKNPDAWLNRASAFGTPRDILEKAAPNMELAWDMDPEFVKRAMALGARMEALGMIRKQPDYKALFDLRFVNRLKREIVSEPRGAVRHGT